MVLFDIIPYRGLTLESCREREREREIKRRREIERARERENPGFQCKTSVRKTRPYAYFFKPIFLLKSWVQVGRFEYH